MIELTASRPPGPTKLDVVAELGEPTLLLPSLVNRGLDANERVKYLLSLLQAARARADDPSQPWSGLRDERLGAGVADPELDQVVERSRRDGPDLYFIPGGGPNQPGNCQCDWRDARSAVGVGYR